MPSQNPDLTPRFKLPSPVPADPPDIPGDIKALTTVLDSLLGVDAHQRYIGNDLSFTYSGYGTWKTIGGTPLTFTSDNTGVVIAFASLGLSPGTDRDAQWRLKATGVTGFTAGIVRISGFTSSSQRVPTHLFGMGQAADSSQVTITLEGNALSGAQPATLYDVAAMAVVLP